MERIVADLVVGTHGENRSPRRVDRSAVECSMCGSPGTLCATIRICLGQMCGELLPQCVRNRRCLVRKARQARSQRALTRETHFVPNRILVVQIERTQ